MKIGKIVPEVIKSDLARDVAIGGKTGGKRPGSLIDQRAQDSPVDGAVLAESGANVPDLDNLRSFLIVGHESLDPRRDKMPILFEADSFILYYV